METSYKDLLEQEKVSDRIEARKILLFVSQYEIDTIRG